MGSRSMRLASYPLYPHELLAADQALLDELLADSLSTGDEPSAERFLFGNLPVAVFDRMLEPTADVDLASHLWLMHLSGYFGGRWLRGEIVRAQPEAMLAGVSVPPSEDGFLAPLLRAERIVAATDPEALIEGARRSLFDEPPEVEGAEPLRGLVDTFGYNAGYMLEILASPPDGLVAPARYQVTCSRLLSCDYASPKLRATAILRPVAEALDAGTAGYGELVETLAPLQASGIERGRAVWSTGLSVQGFGAEAYDQLLDVSSSFLETVEGTALTMVRAAVEHDAVLARAGARATAAMVVWLASYLSGLLNGEEPIELPMIIEK